MSWSDAPELPSWLGEALPGRRRSWTVPSGPFAGETIHVVEHGDPDGAPVWLQHGNPMWAYLWRKVTPLLAEAGRRCITPDLVGFGLSSKPRDLKAHQLEAHLDALGTLWDALDLERVVLVGQDWGGPMVGGLGARDPERVAGLVFANTSVLTPKTFRGTSFHRFARLPLVSDLAFRVLGFPLGSLHGVQGDRSTIRGEVARAYRWPLRRYRDRAGPLALARMVPDRDDHPSVPALERIDRFVRGFEGPVRLVWGVRDPILGRALKRHREAWPDAPCVETNAGHFLQEEVPQNLADAVP